MIRILVRLSLVVALLGLGVAAYKDVLGVRTRAEKELVALLDGLLGVKPAPGRPAPAAKAPAPQAARPSPTATPPAYVDRSPTPSALERVKPQDQKRLDDLVAQKTAPKPAAAAPAKTVASRNPGAKRPATN